MMEPLSLSHQELIQSRLSSLGVQLSEYTFANLFLFRKTHEHSVLQVAQDLFIKGKAENGTVVLMPTAKLLVTENLLQLLEFAGASCFYPIPEEWIVKQQPSIVTATFLEMDSDYVFERELLVNYPGRHLSKKRNLVHQFLEAYGPALVKPLDESTKEDAVMVLEKWKEQLKVEADKEAALEAILLARELRLQGFIYYLGKVAVGFIIGEPLGKDVFVIHFAKADKTYKGIYQYMYQDFAKRVPFAWINMEQDLGQPKLRQAKHSYQPTKLLKKYRLFKKC